ncbi:MULTISPECIES: D-erythronate dehydrogenase [Variovorax]|jgi:D-erythronate 2-dehydrogenase|uniref:D-erythronate dehydrogenase n=1 Tax=Variovorax TaxID=34072 RepID=UPI00086CAD85|nr:MULTISPECIES: D-erythronate dehydrogenase [Variovorax]MBN8757541.1 SDR family oxidoreductase [Variovorax sp.]ODU13621.1 MAG: NAD-dependent epimerase [Variovorax sp. SCN 67-85]ODV20923.1 MAG: NAD-dependent epimerase [Variovorax sp. SCN 67-20]OJZ08113.1 MAG: NAD-dependent epimerase [Variovorax sp. 67-131]UKI05623.1 SDR family oxidoreductase [Variovorax paradoxus]
MHIVITGGAGFLGARLARTLLKQGSLALAGAPARPIERVTLVDRAAPPADLASDARISAITGDLNAQLAADADATPWREADAIFHLAAAVSGECEADFDLGMRSNFAATHALLEKVRTLGTKPVLVFSSSLAVFGDSPEQPLPKVIEDHTLPTPQTSYGIQKFIGEQLVADFTRKGFVRGRSVRLMTVSVRPGKPNGAASGFFSGMVREPLAGLRAACPVPDATPVAIASPARTVEGIIRAAEASDAEWGPRTALNLPSLATTVGDMAAALERVAGKAATALLDRTPDPAIQRIVKTWPGHFETARARALGLTADESFEAVIREYVRENPDAVKLPVAA